jgi:AraC-like DNA-binding protein
VGTALAYFQQHFHLHDRIGVATRSVEGSRGALGYTLIEGSSAETDHIHDAAIAIAMTSMRVLVGPDWKPRAVTLPRRKPRNVQPYVKVFGVLPQFEAEHPGLHFSARDFDRPIAGADPDRFALLIEKIRTVADAGDIDFVEQVRRALRGLIALRRCSADDLAGTFSMSRRHLNRKLAERGVSYRQIHDEARWTLAERMLLRTDKSLMEISAALNYADASAFSRAFKGWKGESPSEWRKRARAAEQ